MNNLHYFKYSLDNDDDIIDFSNPEGVMVISKDINDGLTTLMKANHSLIENITAYKVLRDSTDDASKQTKKQILGKIINILEGTDLINYSSFCVYFQVLKYSYSAYNSSKSKMNYEEKIELVKKIVELYIDNRHNTYLSHGYSDQVLQVMSDAASSRRNGTTGIKKIEEVIVPKGFEHVNSLSSFLNEKLCYLLPDKGDKSAFNSFISYSKITFEFHTARQNKYPDMLLKINNDIFIIEHKLTNGDGGSQNSEINEIIDFIKEKESDSRIHYVSCLQGNFMKNLSKNATQPKNIAQYNNITKNLEEFPSNFFVNGAGLAELINDYLKDDVK